MGYLTKTDKLMLNYLEKWGSFTITQAGLMFFRKNNNNYTYARKRLHILHERGIIKRYTSNITNEYIYYYNKKPTGEHATFSMTPYALLQFYGASITYYKREKKLWNDKIRVDFFTIFQFGDKRKAIIGEVNLNYCDIERLEEYYTTGELQEQLKGNFPIVMIMSEPYKEYKSDVLDIINCDLKCTEFASKVLSL
jgi:hypothetical protein